MGYITPCDASVTDSWQGHKNRNPPSLEPGTDYGCAYGTAIRAAESGVVDLVNSGPSTPMGRHVGIKLDDGRYVRYLHLSETLVSVGQRVGRAQTIGRSGASANGSNYGSGVHVHVSLWSSPGQYVGNTIDFERYLGDPTTPPQEEDDMFNDNDRAILETLRNQLVFAGDSKGPQSRDLYKIVHAADGGGIWIIGISGKRVQIQQPYHVELLQRLRNDDKLLLAEIDICRSYMSQVFA
ncbi:M23 family metallopeptidase [uncultured Microbacterium sp.]|uniref:M23 family metallopeptidase n=1 Tax=uncultured Microbacterium sp. TaxID=191216 RepID=UPI0037499A7E